MIRDKNTSRGDFIFYSNRIIRLLVEEGLNHLPCVEHSVITPTGKIPLPTLKATLKTTINGNAWLRPSAYRQQVLHTQG